MTIIAAPTASPAPAAAPAPGMPMASKEPAAAPAASPPPAAAPAPISTQIGAPAAEAGTAEQVPASDVIVYETTGDAGLDMSLEFVGKLGFGPDSAAMQAAAKGDFAILKAQLGMMGDKAKGWERYVALGEQAHKATASAASAKQTKDAEIITAAAGGVDQWNAIKEWAGAAADDAEKEEVNAALRKGGTAAKAMVVYLKGLYEKAGGVTKQPAAAIAPGAATNKAPTSGALSPREYTKAVSELYRTSRGGIDGSQAYKALQARRAMWRG
jgi:hypothetical protein